MSYYIIYYIIYYISYATLLYYWYFYIKVVTNPLVLVTPKRITSAQTRGTSTVFRLGSAVAKNDSQITGACLPTGRQVLHCMMYHMQEGVLRATGNFIKWESANIVLAQVSIFHGKANIPMISECKACERIITLYDEMQRFLLLSIPCEMRSMLHPMSRLQKMETKFAEEFPLWPMLSG